MALCCLERLNGDDLTRFNQLAKNEMVIDINCTNDAKDGLSTPFLLLCRYNQSDSLAQCIEILLQQRPDIHVNQTDKDGNNSLMYLCEYSKSDKIVEVAQLLILNGIDVNHTDRWRSNALVWLCALSKSDKIVEVAQLLIEKGTDVKQTN